MDRENMKQLIIKNLKKDEAISFDNLIKVLNLEEIEEVKLASELLVELQKQYRVSTTRKGKYLLFDDPKIKVGRVEVKSRAKDGGLFGFVIVEGMDDDIFINGKYLNGALDGELVRVDIFKRKNCNIEGKIVEIIEKRDLSSLVGEVAIDEKGKVNIILDDSRIKYHPKVLKSDFKLVDGHKVLLNINRDKNPRKITADIVEVIGHKNEPCVDILSIAYAHGFKKEWSKEAKEEVKRIPDQVMKSDMEGRRDLREEVIFTIDGDDTKDIDDAIAVKRLKNGNYYLGVHIANVSHYVKKGSYLDKEAYQRGTSVYMIDTVLPMLPPELSNGICSLNPNVDRLALSCDMEIDNTGNVVKSDIYASIINSKKKMTYKNVNSILEKDVVPEGYADFEEEIRLANEMAILLRKNKEERGMLNFSSREVKFKVDEKGIPIEIVKRKQGAGEKLIEDFMIAANETVASYFDNIGYPSIYRVHETPDEEKVDEFVSIASGLDVDIPNKNKKYNLYPKAFQELMNLVKEKPKVYNAIMPLALRSQKKAVYSTVNQGHFGLASKCYTHFTSPIRRYPDKKLHELIEKAVIEKNYSVKTLKKLEKYLIEVCKHSSVMEREAESCEREADDMKSAELMSYHIGEIFDGIVTGVTPDALFVEASNNAEGRLHISELRDDEYNFNSQLYRFEGRKFKKTYSFGDDIKVLVKSASKERRKIDFGIPEENEGKNS